jgi:DNA-binding transcriptional LysR family regulator
MTLEQLTIFVAVAEREHLTRAAQALHLSPSAVSAAVRALEARYQVALFDRLGRGMALSAAGRQFLPLARATIGEARRAEAALAELGTFDRGELAVQASQTIANYWLPARLGSFRREHPQIEIALQIGNTQTVARAIAEGQAELGFIEGATAEPRLSAIPVASDRLVVVVPAAARPTGLSIVEDVLALDWIMREPGSGTRAMFEDGLRALGIVPEKLKVAMTLPSNEAVLTAVRSSGSYATALSESVVAPFVRGGDLAVIDLPLKPRDFMLLHHAERPLSRTAQALVSICRESAEAALS